MTAAIPSIGGVIRYPGEIILGAPRLPAHAREPVAGCPRGVLSFCASPCNTDLTSVITAPEFLRRSALGSSVRGPEHAVRDDELVGPSCARDSTVEFLLLSPGGVFSGVGATCSWPALEASRMRRLSWAEPFGVVFTARVLTVVYRLSQSPSWIPRL